MSDIKVTQAEIDLLLNSADVQVRTEFGAEAGTARAFSSSCRCRMSTAR